MRMRIFFLATLLLGGCIMAEASVPVTLPPLNTPRPGAPTPIPVILGTPATAAPIPTDTPLPPPPVPIAGAVGPYTFPENVNPLTGLTVDDPAVLDRRPMVVKISNAPPLVRPQAGIGQADLVYEHYAEGGLTRFSAIFYSQSPERVGSIRSARLIDYELVPMYHALLAYSGASNGVQELIAASNFADRAYMGILYGNPYYWRDETIDVPHNLFMNAAALWRLASEDGVNARQGLHGMAFDAALPANSAGPANAMDLHYRATHVRWEYDPSIGKYRRFSDGEPHLDANTNQQVTADNVVILYANHEFSDIVESEFQGTVSYGIRIQLWFEGDAVLFRDGQRYDCRWIRPTREDMISLRTNDGQIMYFKPGVTWFQAFPLPEQENPAEESLTVE